MIDLTVEQLGRRLPELIAAADRERVAIDPVWTCAAPGAPDASTMAPPPAPDDPAWRPLAPGERWGARAGDDLDAPPKLMLWGIPVDNGSTHWLRATLAVPEAWRDRDVRLALVLDYGSLQAADNLEGIVYLDGAAISGVDGYHRDLRLPPAAHAGAHELLIRVFVPYPQRFAGLSLVLRDDTLFQLGHSMVALLEAAQSYSESDIVRHRLLAALRRAYNTLDLRAGWASEALARSAVAARDELLVAVADLAPGDGPPPGPRLVSTGHAHLDVAWLWPLWRTRQKVAHTVATALRLMDEDPDYHFSMSQPHVYQYLKEDDPALYARMRERIAEGRFEPVGVMWVEPDTNVTSGESLVRQIVYGARFFSEEFGDFPRHVWLPDVFGYSAAMPQLLRLAGIELFFTTKISWSQTNRFPYDTFRWRGIDGSEVLAHFVTATDQPLKHPADPQTYTYVGTMTAREVFGTWNHYRQKPLNEELLYVYGWGDGGGGPTEEMLARAHALKSLPGFPQVQLGRVDAFFEGLQRRVGDDPALPRWVGELYLEYHRGTYTSQARTKRQNRQAELLYREAEWLNAWATLAGGPNRQEALEAGWRHILLNQFHDILPGSSIRQVYLDSDAQYAEVRRIAGEVTGAALAELLAAGAEGTAGSPGPVVLNSLPWERAEPVLLPAGEGPAPAGQAVTGLDGSAATLVAAAAPGYGYAPLVAQTDAATDLVASREILENSLLRLELDERGELRSLFDKEHGRELVLAGATLNQLVAYEDRPLRWDAWDIDRFYEEKPYPVHELVSWELVETGPLRAAIELTRRLGTSSIRQRICLWRGSRRVDFLTEVQWEERQTLLRALFPLNLNAERATCEIQFGAVERPTHRNTSWDQARFEVSAHRWVDLGEGDYGVALLNDGIYGHSLHGSTLGLSLLKGAVFPDPDADRGTHRFTYSLYPHPGDWRQAQVVRRAYELNAPLRAVQGLVAEPVSLLAVAGEHVVVETVKAADDGDGLIVRLYEAHNSRGPATLRFGRALASAELVDLLERPLEPLPVAGHELRVAVRPYEVKTMRVRFA